MTTNLKRLLALLFAFSLVAAACGSNAPEESSDDSSGDDGTTETTEEAMEESDDDATEESDDDGEEVVAPVQGSDLTFYMITHSDDGPFWSVLKRGADQAAEDLGVTVVWNGSNNDPAVQASDIDAAVASGADGIAASLPSPDQLIPGLKAAVDAGIPVYTLNSGVNDYQDIGATTHVGQTEVIAGNGAGQRFNNTDATHILCGRQEQDNVALVERCDGLAETFSGKVTSAFMDLDADQTAQEAAINAAMAADPSIDGFMGVGPVITMSGLRASQALGREMPIGGFDITPELIDAIEAGEVSFTVDQQQYLQGYMPVLLMFLEATNKNTLGGGLPILTGPGFVTADNAADVKALVAAGTR